MGSSVLGSGEKSELAKGTQLAQRWRQRKGESEQISASVTGTGLAGHCPGGVYTDVAASKPNAARGSKGQLGALRATGGARRSH